MEKYSFEEYKLVYDSAEKVTDRRLSNNKTNYSISIAILAAIAIIWKWTIDNNNYFFCGIILVLILAGFATVFCSLWIGQINDFKKLNQAKFDVINKMATNIKFGENQDIVSYEPFDKEWKILSEINALQEKTKHNIIALKSTNTEFFIPKAFRIIFFIILLVSILTILLNLGETWIGIKLLLKLK